VSFRSTLRENRSRVFRISATLHVLDSRTGVPGPTIAISESSDLYPLAESGAGYAWFGTRQSYTATPDGHIVMTHVDGKDLDVTPLRSDSTWRIRLESQRRQVESADLSGIREATFDLLGTIGLDPAVQADQELAMLSLPHHKYWPVVGRLVAASTSEVLVERPDLSDSYGGLRAVPTTWDLVTSTGRIVGRLELPGGSTPMALTDGALVSVSRDSLDVPSIVWYRLVRPARVHDQAGSRPTG
jgi:hypothetical protein